MVQAARPHLKKGAAIINCTSVTMYKGSEALLDYSATKGAITALTRSLALNLVKDGILFLACENSSYMAGHALHPDGGTVVNG